MPKLPDGQWALYLITCKTPKHLYVGITCNPYRRRRQHGGQWHGGAVFVKRHGVAKMEVLVTFPNKKAALKAEMEMVKQAKADNKDWIVAGSIWCGPEGYDPRTKADVPRYPKGQEPWREMLDNLEKANA